MIRLALAFCLLLLPLQALAQPMAPGTPRPGLDFEVLPQVQPTWAKGDGIEVAEVFSYGCGHCAQFQPQVDAWLKKAPKNVRWRYVPAAFGGSTDNFARAFLAAERLRLLDRTHDAVFKAIHADRALGGASLDELADLYATLGVDRARFLATMQSAPVTADVARARDFSLRTGIQGTPTLIVAGKYRLNVTRDRGFEGLLRTLEFVLEKERAMTGPARPKAARAGG